MSVKIGEMQVYARIGEAGFSDLISRFYAKVRQDDLVGPMYPRNDWENAQRRLRMFLIQRFGGPETYGGERGHPRLRARHASFRIDRQAAGRWLGLMQQAMQESLEAGAITPDAAEVLWPFFVSSAEFMINRPSEGCDSGKVDPERSLNR